MGKRDDELFPPDIAAIYIAFKREVLAKKGPVEELDFAWQGSVERYDTRAEPLRDADGNVVGLTIVLINITDPVRNEERSTFLADASQLLSSSLDYETTLAQIAVAMVPKLADWCSVDIVDQDRHIIQVAVAHVDPDKVKWAKGLRDQNPPTINDPAGLALVLRTGKSEFYPEIPQALLEEALRNAEDEEHRQIIRSVGFKSVMIVPLITRGIRFWAPLLWFGRTRTVVMTRQISPLPRNLAWRVATAVDHARSLLGVAR